MDTPGDNDLDLKRLLLPASLWHWAAYAFSLAMLIAISCYAGRVGGFEGDDLNMALGIQKAIHGLTPLQYSYRFPTAVALYYPLYWLASLGADPLTVFVVFSLAATYLFVLVFSLFAARCTGSHFSFCLLSLLCLQEVMASFMYANDMSVGLLFLSCGLAFQVFRPRLWLVGTLVCAILAVSVRTDLVRIIALHVILDHFQTTARPVRHWRMLWADLAICVLIPLGWALVTWAGGGDIAMALALPAKHLELYLNRYYQLSYVTMEVFRSTYGLWLVLAALGFAWMAWNRKLILCLLVGGFSLIGLLLVFPYSSSPKYLLPHLAVASLTVAYALDRLFRQRKAGQALGAGLVFICLLCPLVGTPSLHKLDIGPLSLSKWHWAEKGDACLLHFGTGRVLHTHDGVRLDSGYLFVVPLIDLVKQNYLLRWEEVKRWLDKPEPWICFSQSRNWFSESYVIYEMVSRGYRDLERGRLGPARRGGGRDSQGASARQEQGVGMLPGQYPSPGQYRRPSPLGAPQGERVAVAGWV